MKEHLIVFGIITVVLISGFSGCVGPQTTDYFNGEYTINPYTILSVSNINGQVEITGWDGDNVTVNAVKKTTYGAEELRNVNISVSQTENHLEIVTRYTGQKLIQASVDYNIKVPYNVTIETITTSNGAIQVSKTKGGILATTSNGAIIINDIDGVVSATTSNGHIEIQGTTGIGNLRTSNAAITADVQSVQNDISIETSNAAISLSINPFLNATFDMTTSNAKVTLQGISLNVSLSGDTHVIGTLGGDGYQIDVHTSNANIYLNKLET
jgi:fructose-specific phosphotransferase system component IIB